MKALLDTNPLVSALLKPMGPSGQIFQRWRAGEFELTISPSTLIELTDVLHRPHIMSKYRIREIDIASHLNVLNNFAEVAPGILTVHEILDDPKDNHVLAAAMETNSAYLVSGDHHLLDMQEYQNISILNSRDFLLLLESAENRV